MKITTVFLAVLFSFASGVASAATVNTVACNADPVNTPDICVTSVDGVVINGTTYNVNFVYDTFTNLNVGDNFPFYPTYGGPGDASVAVDAINLAINTHSTHVERILAAGSSTAFSSYEVVKQPSAGPFQNTSRGIASGPAGSASFARVNGVVANEGLAPHAVFTVVPVPAALWLFGSAIAGLGWRARRK
ncbi:MAG: PEP-CTERM sorting domain-containing protein [Gammaproteobacteria bacterium]|nr:VPLPA-CTERM sorting domain-containing protein [Gammaproteobacteria bacterium]NND54457.1 PEP-CTERM sorting domain-containing protein [Gammaproteobacteria bacterium]